MFDIPIFTEEFLNHSKGNFCTTVFLCLWASDRGFSSPEEFSAQKQCSDSPSASISLATQRPVKERQASVVRLLGL